MHAFVSFTSLIDKLPDDHPLFVACDSRLEELKQCVKENLELIEKLKSSRERRESKTVGGQND